MMRVRVSESGSGSLRLRPGSGWQAAGTVGWQCHDGHGHWHGPRTARGVPVSDRTGPPGQAVTVNLNRSLPVT
eukprot:841933-Rhodomonas_salina.2